MTQKSLRRSLTRLVRRATGLPIPLAATSTNAMIKRFGGKRWQTLHRAVYAIAVFAVLHFWWMVKKDITQPEIYAAVLALLLGVRLYWAMRSGWLGGAALRG